MFSSLSTCLVLFSHVWLSFHICGSLFTYVGLFSHMWVSFHIFGSLFTYVGLFSHIWVSFHTYVGLFSHMWVSFHMCRSFQSMIYWKDVSLRLFAKHTHIFEKKRHLVSLSTIFLWKHVERRSFVKRTSLHVFSQTRCCHEKRSGMFDREKSFWPNKIVI